MVGSGTMAQLIWRCHPLLLIDSRIQIIIIMIRLVSIELERILILFWVLYPKLFIKFKSGLLAIILLYIPLRSFHCFGRSFRLTSEASSATLQYPSAINFQKVELFSNQNVQNCNVEHDKCRALCSSVKISQRVNRYFFTWNALANKRSLENVRERQPVKTVKHRFTLQSRWRGLRGEAKAPSKTIKEAQWSVK